MVFLSQVDRSFDSSAKPCPDLVEVRLPNPLDMTLFQLVVIPAVRRRSGFEMACSQA